VGLGYGIGFSPVRDRFGRQLIRSPPRAKATGLPLDAQGIFTFGIGVPDDATIYVAVMAYDYVGQESGYSNEGTRSPAPSEPDPVLGKPGTPYVVS
jgi:hypothetical protein